MSVGCRVYPAGSFAGRLSYVFYKESCSWHKNAIQVLQGLLLCFQSVGTCLFVMMRAIQWSLVGMIENIFLKSPLIRSQDGVVDLLYVSVIPHRAK